MNPIFLQLAEGRDMSVDVILPFSVRLKVSSKILQSMKIMVNGPLHIFIGPDGRIEPVPGVAIAEKSLQVASRNIARALGDEIGEENHCSIPGPFQVAIRCLQRGLIRS
jgi:hypothetical protein